MFRRLRYRKWIVTGLGLAALVVPTAALAGPIYAVWIAPRIVLPAHNPLAFDWPRTRNATYSYRRATIGSVRTARRAGSQLASMAAPIKVNAIVAIVTGSMAGTSNN